MSALARLGRQLGPKADGSPGRVPAGTLLGRQGVVEAVDRPAGVVLVALPEDDEPTAMGWLGPLPAAGDSVLWATLNGSPWVLGVLAAPSGYRCQLTRTTALAVADSTWTNVAFDREDRDPDGMHPGGSAGITVPVAGWWRCSGGIGWAAPPTGAVVGRRGARWTVNGVPPDNGGVLLAASPQQNGVYIPARSLSLWCEAGDVIVLQAFQNNATGASVSTVSGTTEGQPSADVAFDGRV